MTVALRAALFAVVLTANASTVVIASQGNWLFDKQPADARFRYFAREMYKDLATPSCEQLGVPAGFDRMASLTPERAALGKYEREVEGTPAEYQLEMVKNDRLLSGEDVGCMADDDIRFANMHVEWSKDRTRNSLERMRQLRSSLPVPPESDSDLPPMVSAEFRKKVRGLVWRPECTQTSKASNEVLFGPSQLAIDDFRQQLIGTPYEFHFDVAATDVKLRDDITIAECDEPGSEAAAKLQQHYLGFTNKLISEMKAIMAQPSGAVATKP